MTVLLGCGIEVSVGSGVGGGAVGVNGSGVAVGRMMMRATLI